MTARPSTTKAVDACLRIFSEWLIDHDPTVIAFRQINRRHIEAFKLWLATRENQRGEPLKKSTIHLRLSTLRVVFERLIEWDHPDTPTRNPIMWTDLPKMDEPLPKFLDDDQAARFMAAAVRLDPQRRLVVEMLARTGLRVTEFCELTHDAIVKMNETNWLRVPVGKLHTDRYVPLHPSLIELHRTWPSGPAPTTPVGSSRTTVASSTATRRRPQRRRLRTHRRDRPRPPPPTASHARDAVDQQRHEPRSRVRHVGAPIDAHDPRLRPHRRPHRRRRILRRRRQSRPALHHPLDNITGIRAEAGWSPEPRSGDSVRRRVRVVGRRPARRAGRSSVSPCLTYAVGCMSSMRLPNGSVT